MPPSDHTKSALRTTQAALSAFTSHPSWPEYEAVMEKKIDRLERRAMAIALSPTGANQRELDLIRGSILAINWVMGVPVHAESALLRFLEENDEEERSVDDG